jgi:hypothetical protein
MNLSLAEAIKTGRLEEFIAQEEARGIGPAKRKDLDRALHTAFPGSTSKHGSLL